MKKLLLIVALVAMFAGSAVAADWNFYGSARIATFYDSTETIDTNVDDIDSYDQALQGNSRIGANVKVSDELTARFEYGTGVNVRILYGEWNFGSGKFLVGQTYSPLNMFYSNQVYGGDNDMLAQGGVYSGREQMLQLTFGDFKIAVLPTNKANDGFVAASTEDDFPALEASYVMKMDSFGFKLAGGYQSYDATVANVDYGNDSYVIALGADFATGGFYLNGNIYAGQNAGNLIAVDVDGSNNWDGGLASLQTVNGVTQLVDNDAFGVLVAAGYTVNDMFSFEAGYAFVETELDLSGPAGDKDKAQTYYVQATITMAPGVFVVPEIGAIDGDDAGQSKIGYFGAKWQINF